MGKNMVRQLVRFNHIGGHETQVVVSEEPLTESQCLEFLRATLVFEGIQIMSVKIVDKERLSS